MSATAMYRALVDAGANEDLAKDAVENVVYAPEAATKSDVAELRAATSVGLAEHREATKSDIAEFRAEMAEFRAEMAEFKTEIRSDLSALRVDMERGFRGMTWRFVGLLLATQTLLFAALRMTGTG